MASRYDLIIVGAGPAGSTCALYTARAGLKVLLLDKNTFPRDKICGDAISGKSVNYLEELGLVDAVQESPQVAVSGILFSAPNGTKITVPFIPRENNKVSPGFVCRRKVYDNILFQEAKKHVETIENFKVTDFLQKDGHITGVSGINANKEALDFEAKVVVGADGYNSILSRKLGFYEHDPKHWVVATRAYYRGVTGMTDAIEIHFVKDVLPGYFWIFPLEDGLVNVGIGMLHNELKKRQISLPQAHMAAVESPYFRERFKDAELLGKISGWNLPVGSKQRKASGDGFVLLGDAAGLIDPFSGEGIGNAMCSGKIAAEVLTEVCKGSDFSAQRLREYDQKLWQELGDELRTSTMLQKLGRFQPLLNLVVNKAAKSNDVRILISEMMAGVTPRNVLLNPWTYLRLLFV
ncbi:MAG: geranylgeranyl reductase family protein [Calditrichaeota bacterium]|nr:MAG: geranylgeranyl reductase family protein [Calditrichota bacterium]